MRDIFFFNIEFFLIFSIIQENIYTQYIKSEWIAAYHYASLHNLATVPIVKKMQVESTSHCLTKGDSGIIVNNKGWALARKVVSLVARQAGILHIHVIKSISVPVLDCLRILGAQATKSSDLRTWWLMSSYPLMLIVTLNFWTWWLMSSYPLMLIVTLNFRTWRLMFSYPLMLIVTLNFRTWRLMFSYPLMLIVTLNFRTWWLMSSYPLMLIVTLNFRTWWLMSSYPLMLIVTLNFRTWRLMSSYPLMLIVTLNFWTLTHTIRLVVQWGLSKLRPILFGLFFFLFSFF